VGTSATCSGSANANIRGACGADFGRGGRWHATAFIGTSIHGFSASGRQQTIAMRALALAARRMLVNAPTGSPKNIEPKAEVSNRADCKRRRGDPGAGAPLMLRSTGPWRPFAARQCRIAPPTKELTALLLEDAMKYMLSWSERPQGSPMEYENAQKRILEVFTQWKAPDNFKIELFVIRVGDWGGYMLLDCDDPLAVHKFCSMLPAFVFEARPVVPVMDAVRVELEAIAFRDGLKRK